MATRVMVSPLANARCKCISSAPAPPQVFCLIMENSKLRVANGCANTILATTMDPRRPKEV